MYIIQIINDFNIGQQTIESTLGKVGKNID